MITAEEARAQSSVTKNIHPDDINSWKKIADLMISYQAKVVGKTKVTIPVPTGDTSCKDQLCADLQVLGYKCIKNQNGISVNWTGKGENE